MLKPGKKANSVKSLRGIRLLSSLASWFGQVFDSRARRTWKAGKQQFGYQRACGCAEAVSVLLALVQSRLAHGRR
eukprot:11917690-Karenia_brevis.AAC.1